MCPQCSWLYLTTLTEELVNINNIINNSSMPIVGYDIKYLLILFFLIQMSNEAR